jgi:hypothetical protein
LRRPSKCLIKPMTYASSRVPWIEKVPFASISQRLPFPELKPIDATSELAKLRGLIDLEQVVVLTGYAALRRPSKCLIKPMT